MDENLNLKENILTKNDENTKETMDAKIENNEIKTEINNNSNIYSNEVNVDKEIIVEHQHNNLGNYQTYQDEYSKTPYQYKNKNNYKNNNYYNNYSGRYNQNYNYNQRSNNNYYQRSNNNYYQNNNNYYNSESYYSKTTPLDENNYYNSQNEENIQEKIDTSSTKRVRLDMLKFNDLIPQMPSSILIKPNEKELKDKVEKLKVEVDNKKKQIVKYLLIQNSIKEEIDNLRKGISTPETQALFDRKTILFGEGEQINLEYDELYYKLQEVRNEMSSVKTEKESLRKELDVFNLKALNSEIM